MSEEYRPAGEVELSEWIPPAAGTYALTINEIVERPDSFKEGGWRFEFRSEIVSADGAEEDFVFWAPKNYKKGGRPSNLYKWVVGAVGIDNAPEVFRPSEWIKKPLTIQITNEPKYGSDGITVIGTKAIVAGWGAPTKDQLAAQPPDLEKVPF